MPATTRVLILEDSGSPAPGLRETLSRLGYDVLSPAGPAGEIVERARELRPDLVIAADGRRAQRAARRVRAELNIPMLWLAAPEALPEKLDDPFSVLLWPAADQALDRHLRILLEKSRLEQELKAVHDRMVDLAHYRSLYEDSPISLWEEDFSEVKRAVDEIIAGGVTDIRAYLEQHPEEVIRCGRSLRVTDVNNATVRLYKAHSKEEVLDNIDRIFDPNVRGILLDELVAIAEGRTRFESEGYNRDLEGNLIDIRLSWSVPEGDEGRLSKVIVSIDDITERNRRENMLKVIASVSARLRTAETRAEMPPLILEMVSVYLRATSASLVVFTQPEHTLVVELANGAWSEATGRKLDGVHSITAERIAQGGQTFVTTNLPGEPNYALADLNHGETCAVAMPLKVHDQAIGALWVGRKTPFAQAEIDLLAAVSETIASAIHRASLYEKTRRYAEQVSVVSDIGRALSTTLDLEEIYEQLSRGVMNLLPEISGIYISTYNSQKRLISFEFGMQDGERLDFKRSAPVPLDSPAVGSQGEVIRTRQPIIINDLKERRKHVQTGLLVGTAGLNARSGIYVPMLAKDQILGVMFAQSYTPNRFTSDDADLLTLVANTSAVAIQNAHLFAATQRRVQRLTALHAIDVAISSSLDLRVTLNILLDQLTALLRLDAADILLLDVASQTLDYASGRGFRSLAVTRSQLRLGEGWPGRAALDRRIVHIPALAAADVVDRRYHLVSGENIAAYTAAPLIAKGQLKGVLEIFYRSVPDYDEEWEDFLETLAGQVAVAIDNAALVNQLQRTNLELTLAYDTTLEGWSRAVDMRDKNTGEHNRRVCELSVKLARAMGLNESEVVLIRRGALLHDIGKLGIPDGILRKTGPLSDEERSEMQKHPDLARRMLEEIDFLSTARVIPYCHHEKWDGTGYPRGLKGEQIPLAARIFAVVDVWDSLCSNQPYRQAWPQEKAREYIASHAGTHFDPAVVEVFLHLIA